MIVVRPERLADFASVRKVNEQAFGQPNEADLVDALRMHVLPYVSLVAPAGHRLVGHIFFSTLARHRFQASTADTIFASAREKTGTPLSTRTA